MTLPRIQILDGNSDTRYLLLCTNDSISSQLVFSGGWDEHLLHISMAFCSEPNSLVLDIGANLGAYAIPMAKKLEKTGGKVYCFEPQRIVFYQLSGNIFLNRLENVYAFWSAVGDYTGKILLPSVDYAASINVGGFSLDASHLEKGGNINTKPLNQEVEVNIIRLDDLEINQCPSLIKIDVEGYELKVLQGGVNFLQKNNFPPIIFEAWSLDWFEKDKLELLSFVESLGYQLFRLFGDDYIAQHPNYPTQIKFSMENNLISMDRTR